MTSPSTPTKRIGVDFDNTLANYADLFWTLAVQKDLLPKDCPRNKRAVRDALRSGPGGEEAWRAIQVLVYGEGLDQAAPMPESLGFLEQAAACGLEVWIVSHKTKYPNFGSRKVRLREKAMEWLERHGLLEAGRIPGERVRFLSTRGAKVTAIRELCLTHFVDDLPEVFLHRRYPRATQGLLYDPTGSCAPPPGVLLCRSFAAVGQAIWGRAPEVSP
jgi:hypothetical protein